MTDPTSGIKINMTEGLNGIGGACGPGQGGLDESITVLREPVPGMHLVSSRVGGRTPTLDVKQEGMSFAYSVNMTGAKPECGMFANMFEWPGVGTMLIGAQVSVMELGGMGPAEYVGSDVHRDLSRVLLSLKALG
ncbi:hypothetical protein [Arthrobacter psychrolactophilus]